MIGEATNTDTKKNAKIINKASHLFFIRYNMPTLNIEI